MAAQGGHTVLRAHAVVRNFPLRISAADAWGDALVVGTTDGSLLMFAEAEAAGGAPRAADPPDAASRYEVRPARRAGRHSVTVPARFRTRPAQP